MAQNKTQDGGYECSKENDTVIDMRDTFDNLSIAEGIDAYLKRWPKEGYPVTKVEERDGGIVFTMDTNPK